MPRPVTMDLHIHTCLSPCGAPEMVPTRIVSCALAQQVDAIGICDHNASENVRSVQKAAQNSAVKVFGGMEITSREEIHILALFEMSEQLDEMQKIVYAALPGKNDIAFGEQYIVDSDDYVTSTCNRLLIGATTLSIDSIVSCIHRLNGIAVASHVDRPSYSIISQLGIIPEGLELDALEISQEAGMEACPDDGRFPVVSFSDAHMLREIGRITTTFAVEAFSINEIRMAIKRIDGRRVVSVNFND